MPLKPDMTFTHVSNKRERLVGIMKTVHEFNEQIRTVSYCRDSYSFAVIGYIKIAYCKCI